MKEETQNQFIQQNPFKIFTQTEDQEEIDSLVTQIETQIFQNPFKRYGWVGDKDETYWVRTDEDPMDLRP